MVGDGKKRKESKTNNNNERLCEKLNGREN